MSENVRKVTVRFEHALHLAALSIARTSEPPYPVEKFYAQAIANFLESDDSQEDIRRLIVQEAASHNFTIPEKYHQEISALAEQYPGITIAALYGAAIANYLHKIYLGSPESIEGAIAYLEKKYNTVIPEIVEPGTGESDDLLFDIIQEQGPILALTQKELSAIPESTSEQRARIIVIAKLGIQTMLAAAKDSPVLP